MHQCLVCGRMFENVTMDDDATSASSLLMLLDRGPFDDPAHDLLSFTRDDAHNQKSPASKVSRTSVIWRLSRVLGLDSSVFKKKRKVKNGKKEEECVLSELLCSMCSSLLEDAQSLETRLKDTLITLRERVWNPDEEGTDNVQDVSPCFLLCNGIAALKESPLIKNNQESCVFIILNDHSKFYQLEESR